MLIPPFFFVCAIRQVFCFLPRSVYTNSQHSFCVSSVMMEHQLFFMQWWHSTATITERKKAAVLDGKKKKMKQNWLLQVPAFWSKIRTHRRLNRTLILIRRYKMCANFQARCEQTKNTQQMTGEMKFDLTYWRNLSADEDASEVLLFILLYVGIITK